MSKKDLMQQHSETFESIRHFDENSNEYWLARQLSRVLEYSEYRHFLPVIKKAKEALTTSKHSAADHFEDILEMVDIGSGAKRSVPDVRLSRYACYLIVQNGDPFRATQTEEKLRREKVKEKQAANRTHFEVGHKVRQTIKELGGTMPENLPKLEKSIKQIEREKKRIEGKKE